MKVLLISHTCQSRTEGQPKAELLSKMPGIELRVLVPNRWLHYGSWRGAQVPAGDLHLIQGKVRLPWVGPAQWYFHWYPGLAKILKEFRPDVIDLWEEPWGLVSAHASWLRRRLLPQTKIISETEQNILKRLPLPFERFRRYTLRHADFAVARNSQAVDVLKACGYSGRAEVVPNGVDVELFRPMNRDLCRDAIGAKGFQVGYVGRLVEEKGLADLVDALAACDPSVNLLFVGAGSAEAILKEQAVRLGVMNRCRFMAGQPLDQLPAVMNALDCLALPSRTTPRWKEQFGRVLIEAGACGIPVIGSNSGAIPDVVGDAGIVVPERNPAALARAIETLRADPMLCRNMGSAGRSRAEKQFSWNRVAERMAAIYHEVNQPSKPRASSTLTSHSCSQYQSA